MGLGELDGFTRPELKELGTLLTSMIDRGELALACSQKVHDKALEFYNKYKNQAQEIYEALGITTKNFVTLKSVVHPRGPPQKMIVDFLGVMGKSCSM